MNINFPSGTGNAFTRGRFEVYYGAIASSAESCHDA